MESYYQKIKAHYQLSTTSISIFTISLTIAIISLFLANILSNISSFWSIDVESSQPSPDLFFETIAFSQPIEVSVDIAMNSLIFVTLFCILLKRNAIRLYFRFFICMSIGYLLRTSIIAITNFPLPNSNCEKITKDFVTRVEFHKCGDLIFSGHTLIVTLCVLVWHTYDLLGGKVWNVVARMIVYVIGIGILTGILISRFHYSVDVLLGVYVIGFVWTLFGFVWNSYLSEEEIFKNIIVNE